MGLPSMYKPHQRPWRLATSTGCLGSRIWTIRVSVPRPSLTFTQVDVHFVWVLGPVALGVSAGGEATAWGVNWLEVLVGNGGDLRLPLFRIPRMATNNSSTVTSIATGQEL